MTATSFDEAYDEVLAANWPAGTTYSQVTTPYGTTHINSCGPGDAPPLVLLAGRRRHLHRLVRPGGPPGPGTPRPRRRPDRRAGPQRRGERPIRTVADLTAWLDGVLDGLGADRTALGGHSYGAWIALHYALHAPHRVRKLVLVDPTQCFMRLPARLPAARPADAAPAEREADAGLPGMGDGRRRARPGLAAAARRGRRPSRPAARSPAPAPRPRPWADSTYRPWSCSPDAAGPMTRPASPPRRPGCSRG